MATSYNSYSTNDGSNDYNTTYAYDETGRTHPQHVATPHGAMTEILAATGSTSPPSPRRSKLRQPSTMSNHPSSNKESVAKRALRRKAAKHFHRGNSSSSAGNFSTDSSGNSNNDIIDNKNISSSAAKNVKETISSGTAIRSSDKYYYPAEFASSVPIKQEAKSQNRSSGSQSLNVISQSSDNSGGANINGPLDKIIENDDPELEIYEEESASEIGSGYNSGSDLENAARKILQRRNQSLQKSSSKPNYDSDDNVSDSGSAVSSSASSSFRKLPDGWKERIKRKAGIPKLPPTMEKNAGKKEKIPPSSSVAQKPPKEQTQQQEKDQLQPQLQQQQQEQLSREGTDNNDELSQNNSNGGNYYHDHFNAIASVCEDSDDDEYYQDHFNGEVNGAFPSLTNGNGYNHGMESRGMDLLDNPPIYEEHIFGPVKPSTIYESNDEYDHDENDDSLFEEEWNPDNLISKGDGDGVDDKSSIPPIQEVDDAGFPSPSRNTKAHERFIETGLPSSSSTNNDQTTIQQSVQTGANGKGIEHTQNDFNKDDYFHDFSQGWEQNFLPPPGVHWKSSTKHSPSPETAGDGITTTSITDEDATIPSFAWSDSSFRDNTAASASVERSTLAVHEKKEDTKEQRVITSVPVRQKKKKKGKALPAMQPFSDGDLSDPGNNVSNGEGAAVGATQVKAKRGLKFFKRRGQSSYQSDSERSDSDWDTDASKNSQRLKGISPLSRKSKSKKQAPKSTNDLRRKLFGSSPKKQEINSPQAPTETPAEKAVQDTTPITETPAVKVSQDTTPMTSPKTNLKPDHPFRSTTPLASNIMKADDDKPFASVDVDGNDVTDDKSVSTLGSLITKETSSKAVRVASSSASANSAMSEIERLRKENDKLRQELERQAFRRENERLRQELEKRNEDGAIGGNDLGKQNSPRNGKHKMSLSSLLENLEGNAKHDNRRDRRHRVTKNHLMNQADFDDETSFTHSPAKRSTREYASESVGWVVSQVRNAAQDHGHRPLDCFTACTRNSRGQRRSRRHHARGRYDDNDSDTDSLDEDTSFLRNGDRPRPPITRRSR